MKLQQQDILLFQKEVAAYYDQHGRLLPWRENVSPYAVVVSELMLQQTQVPRVIPKFEQFMQLFPDWFALASAPQADVLGAWSGLGYNRRAMYLQAVARAVVERGEKAVCGTYEALVACKGIGINTAAAILVYAYDEKRAFVETNIRTVYLHHFFQEHTLVSDKELLRCVELTMLSSSPRVWYWALMDYGTFLKSQHKEVHHKSKSYKKQSTFEGSKRQIRGSVLRLLIQKSMTFRQLYAETNDRRLTEVLLELEKEGLIKRAGTRYSL